MITIISLLALGVAIGAGAAVLWVAWWMKDFWG